MATKPQESRQSEASVSQTDPQQVDHPADVPPQRGDLRLGCLVLMASWVVVAILALAAVRLFQWLSG
ncbi:hypothetical protein [Blastopirellula marina]|uniref:DUF2474 domain-containing protein n=1 Tax=Blastopirellula marina TaxID=124 RepID=A0A2S8FAL4_9BACT|nr:hypothetical protein [Blastopirellula marina]PQO28974.1 hypothetical protein C5Y98_22440 [Blastopirellula marina]PTL42246.1 hypothetical protein C5Y97_22450 [Blastopirellula marina]